MSVARDNGPSNGIAEIDGPREPPQIGKRFGVVNAEVATGEGAAAQ